MATVEELKKMSILDVAQALGMEMKRQSGNTYYWTEHDSFKINTDRNIWHWFSQDKGGNVFSLVQEIKGVSFKEAKHFLETGEFPKVVIDEKPPEPFRYFLEPYEHPNFDLGREYLRKERGLSEETIDAFLNQGNLAEATRKKGDYFEPVIVFKSRDVDGKIIGASLQGIVENWVQHPERGRFKRVMVNSDGLSGFSFDIGTPNRLIFLEAPIDLMSYYELHKDSLENVRLVAMDGIKKGVISRYTADLLTDGKFSQERSQKDILNALDNILKATSTFEDNPNLITLAVDNDEAGLKFIEKLQNDNVPFQVDLPPKKEGEEKMDWNDYLKQENNTPSTYRLEQAKRKLARLEKEYGQAVDAVFAHQKLTNGQPMNNKRNGSSWFKHQETLEQKASKLSRAVNEQKERVDYLENQADWMARGLDRQGRGLRLTVENIPNIKKELELAETGESYFSKATLRKYKKELSRLEAEQARLKRLTISSSSQALIDSGELNQWQKHPHIYFVKGLRKVALELTDEGIFQPSSRYPAYSEKDQKVVESLLKKQEVSEKQESMPRETETDLSMEQQKALDRSQEPSNTGGELFNRNFSSLETEVSGIALQPEESKTQPDFPANVHLYFNIDRTTKSRFKLRSGYRYPEEKDVRILNSYSDSLQNSAQHYLNDFADQKIIYAFSEEDQIHFLEVDFEKRHWMHLTGIMPVYDEHLPSVAEKFIDEIASGHTTFKNVTLGQGFNDKIKVLPMLSELLEAKAFTFNDLSTVQKFQRLELEKGIKPENKDLILVLKTDDRSTFPASLMKLSQKIYKTIEPDQKVVLGVFAEKGNEIRTLSVNRDYITDGGEEMLTTLQENRAIDQMKDEEKKQSQAQKIEIVQDSDADGLSDEVEYGQGTDPFGPNVKDTQIENISQPEMDTRSVSEMIAANDTKALAQHMKEGVKQYFDSDQYKTFLTAMSQFNNYSPRNIQLLLAQNPKISKVASFKTWKTEFERSINKGEKSLRIWAPSTVTQKDPKTGQPMLDKDGNEIKVTRFRLVPVFDISQTSGKELPKAIYELEGTHEDYANLYRAAKTVSLDKGVSFKIDSDWSQKGNGYYSPKANEIVIKGGMSEQQTLKTIFHEMAHSDLHNSENISENATKRSTAELQAESVAYVVANHYGLDTSEYSFAYLAGWSREPEALSDLEEQLSIVQKEAKSLISRLDTVLEKQVTKTVAQSKFMEQMNHFKKQSQEKLAAKQKEREQEEPPKKSQARQELNEP